jgi:YidC/Oxa1 family membrane protein insertase
LADRACARQWRADRGKLPQERHRRLSGRLCRLAGIVAPGTAITGTTRLFAGAKDKEWLDRYEAAGIPKLSKSIDWGWFEWFMRPIFSLLMWLFQVTGNFGVAIICLTVIVRLLMFPIADKQFRSMAGMRTLQPR